MTTASRRRLVLFTLSFTIVSLATGVVYGWPALRRNLIETGQLSEEALAGIFTAGASSVQGGRFITGVARDAFGTKRTVCVILAIFIAGTLTIAFAGPNDAVALGCGMFMLGLGSGAQLCVQPVSGLFPEHSSMCMASLSGAFQISGTVFLVLLLSGDRSQTFSSYAVVIFCLLLCSAWLLPYGTSFVLESDSVGVAPEEEESATPSTPAATAQTTAAIAERKEGASNGTTKMEQLQSKEYAALLLWFSVVTTPAQYFVLSIGYQLELRGDSDGAYMRIFIMIYALGAPISPLFGMFADNFGLGVSHALSASFLATAFGCLALPYSWPISLQIIGFVCYSIGRLSIWGMFFSNVGRRFGYKNYGWLAGLGLLVSAVVNLLQYPLFTLALDGYVRAVNLVLVSALILTFPYALWLQSIEQQETVGALPNRVGSGAEKSCSVAPHVAP